MPLNLPFKFTPRTGFPVGSSRLSSLQPTSQPYTFFSGPRYGDINSKLQSLEYQYPKGFSLQAPEGQYNYLGGEETSQGKIQLAPQKEPIRSFEPSPEGVRARDILREIPGAIGETAVNLLPGSTLQTQQPLQSPKLSLGLEGLGLLPFGAFAKEAKPIVKAGIEEAPRLFQGLKNLSTKLLEKFRGMPETITEQEFNTILNQAKKAGIKQSDESLITGSLVKEGGKINLAKTAAKVEEQLVPLTPTPVKSPRWSNIGEDFIGDGKYGEIVYQSPIKTSAGNVHFNTESRYRGTEEEIGELAQSFPNYFSHIRYEDMADGKTRKIIETQSDLFQKGGLEQERLGFRTRRLTEEQIKLLEKGSSELRRDVSKLEPYSSNDPLAHLRTFREEVKRAAKDGKDTLLIPSGKTAMKIEGLAGEGQMTQWVRGTWDGGQILPSNVGRDLLKPGDLVTNAANQQWIITDILGDGKFKAVPKDKLEEMANYNAGEYAPIPINKALNDSAVKDAVEVYSETFDISGKVDTKHFVYKLNEEAIPREARRMGLEVEKFKDFNHPGEWWKIKIPKERAKMPVEAFGATLFGPLLPQRQDNAQ